jgi:hypothetical protein
MALGIDTEVVENVKNFIVPLVVSKINTLDLPEIDSDGFKISNMNIDVLPIDTNNI